MSLAWYVVQVATNMEDKVQASIIANIISKKQTLESNGQHEKLLDLKKSFGITDDLDVDAKLEDFLRNNMILVPKEKIEEIRNGKRFSIDRKIFPGYVLVRMDYTDESGLLIKRTPKVSGFVGVAKDSKPVPISQSEVDGILKQVESTKNKAKHRIEFEIGEKVRIIDGPFLDFNAIVDEVILGKAKLRVNVQIFGRETSVELEYGQVEKLQ